MPKNSAMLLERLNEEFEIAPIVERNSNVFSTLDYVRALNISPCTAQRRINELLRKKKVRAVTVKGAVGRRRAYEFIGDD